MRPVSTIPTIEDVHRIKNITDPVIRNLQITHCYHELSAALASHTGLAANWCTFATWASKQAGQTIRKEDLARTLERALTRSPAAVQASEEMTAELGLQGSNPLVDQPDLALSAGNFTSPIDRASEAVSRGNKKVFEEIGYEFVRFYQVCFPDGQFDPDLLSVFCEKLRPGEPPEGQSYLRQAFTHYAQALVESNVKTRAELILLANIEIGIHEQTRLQPEIAESLDAVMISFLEFTRPLFSSLYQQTGLLRLAALYLRRLLGRPTALDLAIQAVLAEARPLLRQIITENMMTISLPSGVALRLGRDLTVDFPESLKTITYPELSHFLDTFKLSGSSLHDSGALDWADLPDRLQFIVALFRCYQEYPEMLEPPFTSQQVAEFTGGRRPVGKL